MDKEIYDLEKYIEELDRQEKQYKIHNTFYFNNKIFDFEFDLGFGDRRFLFQNCDFLKKTNVRTYGVTTEELIFEDCNFFDELNLEKCKFQKNVKFWGSTFYNVNFHNTTFNGLADFWSCTFNRNVIFYKTDFIGTTVFSAATFIKSVLFTYTSISKVVIFRGTKFENGLDLSQAIISGDISLHDITIENFKAVDNTVDNKKYEKYITKTGEIPYSNKRETFRIIKQAYSKNGNEIDSIEYRKREHFTLFSETWRDLANFRKISSSIQNIFILFLNLVSNYFGVSWITGFIFITVVGSLFFLLSITEIPEYHFTTNPLNWDFEYFKYFLEFLNPTHKFEYIQEENLTTKFYVFDFLGRIFVGYGIYQFVQAFRKYK